MKKKSRNTSRWSSVLWLLLFFFAPKHVSGQLSEPFILQNFEKQLYQAESQNWSVTMDRKGYVYAANNSGLLEFDGVEWSFYPSPGGAVMRSVAVDEKGRIYTSGYRDLGYWERDAFGDLVYTSLVPLADSLFSKNEEFWNTVIMGDSIYFHSFTSIFVYDGEGFEVIRPGDAVLSISPYAGSLLVHVSGQGLRRLKNGQLLPFLEDEVLQNQVVHFCLELPGSDILIGTEADGLYVYRDGQLLPYLEEWKAYFSRNLLNRGQLNPNGDLVLGTILDGIIIFDNEERLSSRISQEDGLQNNTVLGLHCSSSNEIWASLDQGLAYLSFEEEAAYTSFEYPEVGAIYAAAMFGEEVYLATNRGVFYKTWNGDEDFSMVPGTQGQAWSCDVFEGQLLVSHNDGTFLIRDHRAERLSQVGGGFNLTRNPLDPSMLIQSTYSNIVFFEHTQGSWRYASQLEGFNDLIRYIEMDHLGNLWASHMHRGIYRLILDGSREAILEEQYLGDSVFGTDHDLQVFKIGNRIVLTTGEQIYTYNDLDDRIVPYKLLNEGLGEYKRAHRVLSGPDHHYWLVSRSGIALFRIFGNEILKIREYPANLFEGHLIDGFENILPLDSTKGLLCLDNGFAILDAAAEAKSSSFGSRKMELKNVEISGRSGKTEKLELEDRTLVIPFNRNSLNLRLAFPFFSGHQILFQSLVEGLEPQWSEPKAVPEFEFTRIPFGDYTIRVRAINQWNELSQEATIALTVRPPWYLKRITVLIYLLIILSLAYLGRYQLVRRIRQREQRIKDRQEREIIRLRNQNLNAELSFKSQELATSTMAMIRKNEFLLELKNTLKAQKDDLGTRYPEKYYNRVIRKIDENIGSMDDWNVFEIHFKKAHEDFLQKMVTKYPHLSHSDLRLCAYLRMNLSSKEIAPLLRISYRGVENHRYRLRKKLRLKKAVNLTDFILSV